MNRQHLLCFSAGLALVALAAFFYLFDFSPHPVADRTPTPTAPTAATSDRSTEASLAASDSPGEPGKAGTATPASTPKAHLSATAPVNPQHYTTGPKHPWQKEIISFVNRLDLTDLAKAEHLLGRVHSLPPEGKVLAMDHATKLIPDEEYFRLRPRIFGLVSSPELRETVLLDVLTRGETVRMPTLVELMRQSATPDQAEVREILVAYLEKDYGTDVQQWESAVRQFLVEHPDL